MDNFFSSMFGNPFMVDFNMDADEAAKMNDDMVNFLKAKQAQGAIQRFDGTPLQKRIDSFVSENVSRDEVTTLMKAQCIERQYEYIGLVSIGECEDGHTRYLGAGRNKKAQTKDDIVFIRFSNCTKIMENPLTVGREDIDGLIGLLNLVKATTNG